MKLNVKIRNLTLWISVFVFILYIFTVGLQGKIYPVAKYSIPILFGMSVFLAWKYMPKEVPSRKTWILPVLMMAVMLFFNNQDLANGFLTQLWFSLAIYGFYIFAVRSDRWHKYFIKMMMAAGCFYIFMTFFVSASPGFFNSVVVPLFEDYGYMTEMTKLYNEDMAVGFAPHYSTNAMYLAVTTGVFVASMLSRKRKTICVVVALLGVAAMFFSGKRAHSIFSLVAIVGAYYFSNPEKITKRWAKMIIGLTLAMGAFTIAAEFIPQLNNVVNRFLETSASGRFEMGRDAQRALALLYWSQHPFIGIGWDGYQYEYIILRGIFLNVHCVYIQLLCEVGIIGSIPFYSFFIRSIRHTVKVFKRYRQTHLRANAGLIYSLYIQIFFLLYCLTGNPLYDAATLIPYVLGCAIGEYYYNKPRIEIG